MSVNDLHDVSSSLKKIDNVLLLPLMKIKKICKKDPDYILQANQATVLAGLATQLFIETFTEDCLLSASLRDSNSKNKIKDSVGENETVHKLRVVYDDLSNIVSQNEKYFFLQDIIPKQKHLAGLVKENKIRYSILENGQQTLNFQNLSKDAGPLSDNDTVKDAEGDIALEEEEEEEEEEENEEEENEEEADGEADGEAEQPKKRELELIDFGIDNSSDNDSNSDDEGLKTAE